MLIVAVEAIALPLAARKPLFVAAYREETKTSVSYCLPPSPFRERSPLQTPCRKPNYKHPCQPPKSQILAPSCVFQPHLSMVMLADNSNDSNSTNNRNTNKRDNDKRIDNDSSSNDHSDYESNNNSS